MKENTYISITQFSIVRVIFNDSLSLAHAPLHRQNMSSSRGITTALLLLLCQLYGLMFQIIFP